MRVCSAARKERSCHWSRQQTIKKSRPSGRETPCREGEEKDTDGVGAAYERAEARDEKVKVREDSGRGAGVSQEEPSGAASSTGSHDTGSSAPLVVLRHLWLQRA